VSVGLRRIVLAAALLALGLWTVVRSGSPWPYPALGLVVGLVAGWMLFRVARRTGRIQSTPIRGWRALYLFNSSHVGVGVTLGAALGIFLAGAVGVQPPGVQFLVLDGLFGVVAGFLLSLSASPMGRSEVEVH
jgi:hypothetical protein